MSLSLRRQYCECLRAVATMFFLSTSHLVLNVSLGLIGLAANTLSAIKIYKQFDIRKSVFQLLLVDALWGMVFCCILIINSFIMLFIPKNEVVCNVSLYSSSVSTYQGVFIAFLIAKIRYVHLQNVVNVHFSNSIYAFIHVFPKAFIHAS